MITGTHSIIYSSDAEADRALLRDVLGLPHVDVESDSSHELYIMTDDVRASVIAMEKRGLTCTAPTDQGWGVLTELSLPGGGKIGVYQPRHARPAWQVQGT